MKIIRKHEQKTGVRAGDNRKVRLILDSFVKCSDWLKVTCSEKQYQKVDGVNVGFHSHPNALELILFLKTGSLEVNGREYHFEAGDAVILEPQDIHGVRHISEHECICILLGKGQPQKREYKKKIP